MIEAGGHKSVFRILRRNSTHCYLPSVLLNKSVSFAHLQDKQLSVFFRSPRTAPEHRHCRLPGQTNVAGMAIGA